MSVFLPLMQQQAANLINDVSNPSLQLQRVILKILYALIEVSVVYNVCCVELCLYSITCHFLY